MSNSKSAAEPSFERSVGISAFTTPGDGVSGIHKQRYSDFIVREVYGGEVLHLKEQNFDLEQLLFKPKEELKSEAAPLDFSTLLGAIEAAYAGVGSAHGLQDTQLADLKAYLDRCVARDEQCPPTFQTHLTCADKAARKDLHGAFRAHAGSLVDTSTSDQDGVQAISLAALHRRKDNPRTRASFSHVWPKEVGNYLQFTLLKENCDTMSACSHMARLLKLKNGPSAFGYAGTKDKRAVTAQAMTVYRKRPSEIARINGVNAPFKLRVGDFKYVDAPIKLGAADGNQFEIVLRQINASAAAAEAACARLAASGFINYYGLQRFGKGAKKSHELGRAIFASDYKLFCDYVFESSDLDARARCPNETSVVGSKQAYREGNYEEALKLTTPSMHSERSLLHALVKQQRGGSGSGSDFEAAFASIPKNMKLIFVHAYQSYLWNMCVSERLAAHGLKAVEGDLVLATTAATSAATATAAESGKGEGENSSAIDADEHAGDLGWAVPVRRLTAEEAATTDITSVVVPLYGSNVTWPVWLDEGAGTYARLLAADGLCSTDITEHPNQSYRMRGAYRFMVRRPVEFKYHVQQYSDPNAELAETEFVTLKAAAEAKKAAKHEQHLLRTGQQHNSDDAPARAVPTAITVGCTREAAAVEVAAAPAATSQGPPLLALHVSFRLNAGAYATMLLRELTKELTDTESQMAMTAAAAAAAAVAPAVGEKRTRADVHDQ